MEISVCVTDEDYEAWRRVRMEVVPGERADTVAELRAQDSPSRLLLLGDHEVPAGEGHLGVAGIDLPSTRCGQRGFAHEAGRGRDDRALLPGFSLVLGLEGTTAALPR